MQPDAPVAAVTGDSLADDRICYKRKRPTSTVADLEVTDQFGTRTLTKLNASLVCTPAIQGAPTTTTTTLPVPRCCYVPDGSYCGGPFLPAQCTALGLTPGNPGDRCDAGGLGVCGAIESAGPCCQEVPGRCSAGGGINTSGCNGIGATFFPNAICDVGGACGP